MERNRAIIKLIAVPYRRADKHQRIETFGSLANFRDGTFDAT